jgi:hypothetical protein
VRRCGLAAVAMLLMQPAIAAECVLGDAVYREAQAGFEIHFHKTAPGAAADLVTSSYTITFKGMEQPFQREVTGGIGDFRTEADARLNCPKGKLSDRQRKRCTVWGGLVYALGDHDATTLAHEDEPAPPTLLLVDFGRTIKYQSELDLASSGVPGDVFTLTGCGK